MSGTSPVELSPLAADMRAQDPDRFLSTLFAPADIRDALFALYAFDHEIAKVRRMVREPMAGLIRLQWWRDALDGIDKGDVLAHPVVAGLSHATRRGLDRGFLDAAIEARERELEEAPPEAFAAFEQHLTATNGGIVRAAVGFLGGDDPKALTVADRLGVALGLLEKLRWMDVERGELPLWLPSALLVEHGLVEQSASDGKPDGEVRRAKIEAIQEGIAVRARGYLASARMDHAFISRRLLPAFFPGTLAEVRLRNLKRSPEHPAVAAAPCRLLWHWLRGRF